MLSPLAKYYSQLYGSRLIAAHGPLKRGAAQRRQLHRECLNVQQNWRKLGLSRRSSPIAAKTGSWHSLNSRERARLTNQPHPIECTVTRSPHSHRQPPVTESSVTLPPSTGKHHAKISILTWLVACAHRASALSALQIANDP